MATTIAAPATTTVTMPSTTTATAPSTTTTTTTADPLGYATQGTITFDGLATGINTTDTVNKLIQAASQTELLQEAQLTRQQNQLGAWQQINTKLLDLRTQAQGLWGSSTWNTLSASSSDENLLTATADSSAKTGSYTFKVLQLAQNHQVASKQYDTDQSAVGTGTLTITVGDPLDSSSLVSHDITIDSSNNTLSGVADAINQAQIGLTASVLNDGSKYRLLVSSDDTGAAQQFSFSGTVGDELNGSGTNTSQVLQTAQDASIEFGSGASPLTITSASNEVSGIIQGVTLNLQGADPSTSVTLNLTRDTKAAEDKIQSFVDSYNDAMSFVALQFAYDANTNTGGILMGNQTLIAIQDRIQSLLVNPVSTGGSYNSLRSIGLELQDDGTLSFDTTKFEDAVQNDAASVEALFRTSGRTDNSKISFVYAGRAAAEPPTSGYEVAITRAAQKATLTAGQDAGLTITQGVNDSLTVALDQGDPFTVTLSAGTYTIDQLAAEVQNKINASSPSSSQVAVSVSGGTRLSITSDRYGSGSEVRLVSGDALGGLGFSDGDSAVGIDVAGTINGEPATGSGQTLTGADGNAKTAGVILQVALTAQDLVDAGGSVTTQLYYTKGAGNRFDEYLQGLTMPVSGTLDMQESGLESSIQDTQARITDMKNQLEQKRQSLMDQFNTMESAVGELNNQGNFLTNALSGLNSNWKWNS